MTQIGQNEPLAPAAAQMATHTSDAIAAAPARCAAPARDGARWVLGARHGRGRQVLEQAHELAVRASGVGGIEALAELLRREPPGRRVRPSWRETSHARRLRRGRSVGWLTDQC
jgi:hypothetical protein